jgi:hypothetical protein
MRAIVVYGAWWLRGYGARFNGRRPTVNAYRVRWNGPLTGKR